MQPKEKEGEIFIIIFDETYDHYDDWEGESEKYRLGLEEEFGHSFEEVNVGPGADVPAFLATLLTIEVPLWTALLTLFFLGKPINENIEAWRNIGRKIRKFFKRPVVLSRHGAAVIAVEAVLDEIGGTPKSIQLLSYRIEDIRDKPSLVKLKQSNKIEPCPETEYLSCVLHVFEIEADGQNYRVGIDEKSKEIIHID